MVGVAQLVEHRIVTPVVVGSIPIVHPIFFKTPGSGLAFLHPRFADVVELVDTPDLGSGAARCESSSLSVRTIFSHCHSRLYDGNASFWIASCSLQFSAVDSYLAGRVTSV